MSLEPEARVMSTGERLAADAHTDAAAAFVECAQSQHRGQIIELYVFGSTVRGETRGRASDVDVLVVLNESERQAIADSLRDIALNVMIEYGLLSSCISSRKLHSSATNKSKIRSFRTSSPRDARMSDGGDMDPSVEREFQQAVQALDDATKARDASLSDAAVIN